MLDVLFLSLPVLTGYCQLCVGVLSEEIPGNKEVWSYNGACLLISQEWPVRRRCRELLKGIFIDNKETLFLFIERMKLILDQQTSEVGVVLNTPIPIVSVFVLIFNPGQAPPTGANRREVQIFSSFCQRIHPLVVLSGHTLERGIGCETVPSGYSSICK